MASNYVKKLTNEEIIALEISTRNINFDSDNLCTYVQWERKGFSVKYGQRSFIKIYLWTEGQNVRKVLTGLFTKDQVQYNAELFNDKPYKHRITKNGKGVRKISKQRALRELIVV